MWETTYWNSDAASPAGHLQNPWEELCHLSMDTAGRQANKPSGTTAMEGIFYPNNRKPGIDKSTYTGKPIPSFGLGVAPGWH
nr:hypothetical protein [Candidatus Brachybacter algidus]